jgi:hypothetical protein
VARRIWEITIFSGTPCSVWRAEKSATTREALSSDRMNVKIASAMNPISAKAVSTRTKAVPDERGKEGCGGYF